MADGLAQLDETLVRRIMGIASFQGIDPASRIAQGVTKSGSPMEREITLPFHFIGQSQKPPDG